MYFRVSIIDYTTIVPCLIDTQVQKQAIDCINCVLNTAHMIDVTQSKIHQFDHFRKRRLCQNRISPISYAIFVPKNDSVIEMPFSMDGTTWSYHWLHSQVCNRHILSHGCEF